MARTPNEPPATALLIVDMISDWEFTDGERLLPRALAIAPRIKALKARCRTAGLPVIYANDNHGRWRSDLHQLVEAALAAGGGAARLAQAMAPDADDYFVLKPRQSAFHATPLKLLLEHLGVRRLVVTGVAADQCVLATVADACMRQYAVVVPRDCIAAQTPARRVRALRHFEETLRLDTKASTALRPAAWR
jgi:nicotinamidase-related amidase